ncbi:MAG: hypothetical protein ACYSR9_09760 [Planctomycetota bacterium]
MEELKFSLSFKLMHLAFKIRDLISPRINILEEVGIEPGYTVLDFGCGPGSYIVPLSSLIGRPGEIFAQDLNPFKILFQKTNWKWKHKEHGA